MAAVQLLSPDCTEFVLAERKQPSSDRICSTLHERGVYFFTATCKDGLLHHAYAALSAPAAARPHETTFNILSLKVFWSGCVWLVSLSPYTHFTATTLFTAAFCALSNCHPNTLTRRAGAYWGISHLASNFKAITLDFISPGRGVSVLCNLWFSSR